MAHRGEFKRLWRPFLIGATYKVDTYYTGYKNNALVNRAHIV